MRHVTAEIEIAVLPQKIFRAFTDVESMKPWWGVHGGRIEARVGGVWALTWDVAVEGFGFVVLTGIVGEIHPEETLRVDDLLYFNRERPVLGPMRLTIDIQPAGATTKVRVKQDGYGTGKDWDWYYELVQQNWSPALERLKEYLETQPAGKS